MVTCEMVQVINITTGDRFETYAVPGQPGSGEICMNGGAARLVQRGDKLIIIAYVFVSEEKIPTYEARVIIVDEVNHPDNEITYRPI